MAELSKITDYITDKASKEAETVIENAEKQYQQEMNDAEISAQAEYNKIINEAQEKAQRIKNMAVSSSEQQAAQEILTMKYNAIQSVISKAKTKIYEMGNEDYSALLSKLFDKYVKEFDENKKGVQIIFNQKDKARITSEFADKLKNAGYEICEDNADIDGGFILKYGRVEENCSIDAIFRDKNEQLIDYISTNLFN